MAKQDPVPPDLQQWAARAGGYYWRIDWRAWDAAVTAWLGRRREVLADELAESARLR